MEDETSPDGRVRISYASREMRMSHMVDVPFVHEVATNRLLFTPDSDMISGRHAWGEGGRFTLHLARYPDGYDRATLHFDIDAGTVTLGGDGDEAAVAHPIADARRLAREQFARNRAAAIAQTAIARARSPLANLNAQSVRRFWAQARQFLLMLVLAIVVLAAALAVGYALLG